jgi:hypothetical protein
VNASQGGESGNGAWHSAYPLGLQALQAQGQRILMRKIC